jgi:hypothetical protein
MWRRTCLALVTLGALMTVGALVPGCAAPGGSPAAPPPGAPTSPAPLPATPLALIGNWTVAGVAEQPDGILRLASGDIRLVDRCGTRYGSWRADAQGAGPAGALLATGGPSTDIGCDNVPVEAWMAAAWRAGLDGETLVLLDAGAHELGRLRRAG